MESGRRSDDIVRAAQPRLEILLLPARASASAWHHLTSGACTGNEDSGRSTRCVSFSGTTRFSNAASPGRRRMSYLVIPLTYFGAGFVFPFLFLIPVWTYLTGGSVLAASEFEFVFFRGLYFVTMAIALRMLFRRHQAGRQFQMLVGLFPVYAMGTLRALLYPPDGSRATCQTTRVVREHEGRRSSRSCRNSSWSPRARCFRSMRFRRNRRATSDSQQRVHLRGGHLVPAAGSLRGSQQKSLERGDTRPMRRIDSRRKLILSASVAIILWLSAVIVVVPWQRPEFWVEPSERFNRAQTLASARRWTESIASVDAALTAEPHNVGYLVFKGYRQLDLKDDGGAEADLQPSDRGRSIERRRSTGIGYGPRSHGPARRSAGETRNTLSRNDYRVATAPAKPAFLRAWRATLGARGFVRFAECRA